MTFSLAVMACSDAAYFDFRKRLWQCFFLACSCPFSGGGQANQKRKGLQLALEPLNGRGIAGYVPKPELWTRPWWTASRENSHIVSALGVLGDVEALTFGLDVDA